MFLAALILASAVAMRAEPPAITLGVATSLEKVKRDDKLPDARRIALSAARGECESAQIVMRAKRAIKTLMARPDPVRHEQPPVGTAALPVALYRVAWLQLAKGSGPDGLGGAWPDPLIPAIDPDFHEVRAAFPIAMKPGATEVVWVELCVPANAEPGQYRGAIRLTDGARALAEVPLELTVWPFAIEDGATLPVTFGLSTLLGTRALGAPDDPALSRALAASLTRHRITPHGLSMSPPDGKCDAAHCALDFTSYDREMAPILDGGGAFAEVRMPKAWLKRDARDVAAVLDAWRRHFAARGWLDKLFFYTLDEPKKSDHPELLRRAAAARSAGIRVFATTAPEPALTPAIGAFAPNVTFFDAAADEKTCLVNGAPIPAGTWWYASCLSHGCGEPTGPFSSEARRQFSGLPGYEIDRPSTAARAMPWLAFRCGIAGELYYDTIQAWTKDPWTDPRAFAGNGDGTLLYPGRPDVLGGKRAFPVESIRLKVIRDGLEDYAYLRLASGRGHSELAQKLARELAASPRQWQKSSAAYLAARQALAEALVGVKHTASR